MQRALSLPFGRRAPELDRNVAENGRQNLFYRLRRARRRCHRDLDEPHEPAAQRLESDPLSS